MPAVTSGRERYTAQLNWCRVSRVASGAETGPETPEGSGLQLPSRWLEFMPPLGYNLHTLSDGRVVSRCTPEGRSAGRSANSPQILRRSSCREVCARVTARNPLRAAGSGPVVEFAVMSGGHKKGPAHPT